MSSAPPLATWWGQPSTGAQAADFEGGPLTANVLLPGSATATGILPDEVPAEIRSRLLDRAIMGPPIGWLASAEAAGPELVARREPRPPQREMANAVQQAANVRGAFTITGAPPTGTGVLLDDRCHSGWTLAMVGAQLRRAGAQRVVPLVLGTLA